MGVESVDFLSDFFERFVCVENLLCGLDNLSVGVAVVFQENVAYVRRCGFLPSLNVIDPKTLDLRNQPAEKLRVEGDVLVTKLPT